MGEIVSSKELSIEKKREESELSEATLRRVSISFTEEATDCFSATLDETV